MRRTRIIVMSMLLGVAVAIGAVTTVSGPVESVHAQNKKDDDKKKGNNDKAKDDNTKKGKDTGAGGKKAGKDSGQGGAPGIDTKGKNIDPITGKEVNKSSIVGYINSIYVFAAATGGLIAILMLIYAGFRYMSSYGDPEKIADAKDIVEKALLGLGLLITAALILQTINPATVNPNSNKNRGDIDFTKADGGNPPKAAGNKNDTAGGKR